MNCIKLIREEKGIAMTKLAKDAEISTPYLFDLERGARGAKPETLERIALGCTVDDLINDPDKAPAQENA